MVTDRSVTILAPSATFLSREMSFNSTPAEFTLSNLVGVPLTTMLGMHNAKGTSHAQGAIRSHPFLSVASFSSSRVRPEPTGFRMLRHCGLVHPAQRIGYWLLWAVPDAR